MNSNIGLDDFRYSDWAIAVKTGLGRMVRQQRPMTGNS